MRTKRIGAADPRKAMPVILTRQDEIDHWLTSPAAEALQLQRPLPDNELIIVPDAA